MTRTASQALVMVGGFIGLIVVAAVAVVKPDGAGLRGALIGAGLGLLNLAVGYLVSRRALSRGMKSATATLAGGFFARLVVVAGLVLIFQRTDAVDPAAFALTFLVFYFVFLGVEVLLVERSANQAREAV
jgi:predicted Na+-dependent transporter